MDLRPSPPHRDSLITVMHAVEPRTPDERHGERDYFSRPIAMPGIAINGAALSPNTLERILPAVQPMQIDAPVIVPRIWGRRIPLPSRLSYVLAVMTAISFVFASSTLAIAILNRRARQQAGHPA